MEIKANKSNETLKKVIEYMALINTYNAYANTQLDLISTIMYFSEKVMKVMPENKDNLSNNDEDNLISLSLSSKMLPIILSNIEKTKFDLVDKIEKLEKEIKKEKPKFRVAEVNEVELAKSISKITYIYTVNPLLIDYDFMCEQDGEEEYMEGLN